MFNLLCQQCKNDNALVNKQISFISKNAACVMNSLFFLVFKSTIYFKVGPFCPQDIKRLESENMELSEKLQEAERQISQMERQLIDLQELRKKVGIRTL